MSSLAERLSDAISDVVYQQVQSLAEDILDNVDKYINIEDFTTTKNMAEQIFEDHRVMNHIQNEIDSNIDLIVDDMTRI